MDPGRSDAELLDASGRERDTFLVFFDRYFERIARYVGRRVGSRHAEELTSEVFVRAFAQRGHYDPRRGDALPWLYGIATNVLREHAKREGRELALVARAGAVLPAAQAEPAEADMDAVVARALFGLSDEEREALFLFVWGDLGYRDVATALDVPLGTVKSRINRARTRLRQELERSGFSSPLLLPEEVTNG